jgi:hypothetical protein
VSNKNVDFMEHIFSFLEKLATKPPMPQEPLGPPKTTTGVSQIAYDSLKQRCDHLVAERDQLRRERDGLSNAVKAAMERQQPVVGEKPIEFAQPGSSGAKPRELRDALGSDDRSQRDVTHIAMLEDQQRADEKLIVHLTRQVGDLSERIEAQQQALDAADIIQPECRFEPGGTGKKFYLQAIVFEKYGDTLVRVKTMDDQDQRLLGVGEWTQWEEVEG